jgi:hypothetical protein
MRCRGRYLDALQPVIQLNVDKTEHIWFSTPRRLPQLPASAIPIGGHDIIPSTSARNLGVYFDADLSMRRHVDIISGCCCAAFVVTSPRLSNSRWWRHWFWRVWITATLRCSVYRPFDLLGCSQCRMKQLD